MTRTMGWVAGSMAWAAPSSSAHPRQQGEPVAQPAALTGRAEHLHGRFLGCRSVACAREEEGDRRNGGKGAQANKSTRLRQRKRRYRHHSLAPETQRLTAGGQNFQPGRPLQGLLG